MADDEKFLSLQVLSALAWADGVVTQIEEDKLVEFLAYATQNSVTVVRRILGETKELTGEVRKELEGISAHGMARLLSYGYAMANAETPITETEVDMLRQVTCTCMKESSWGEVREWLEARYRAETLHAKLFGPGSTPPLTE